MFVHLNQSPRSQISFFLTFLKSILLLNLSQTAYFDALTLSDDRKWYADSIGLNIIFIRAIGCRNMASEGTCYNVCLLLLLPHPSFIKILVFVLYFLLVQKSAEFISLFHSLIELQPCFVLLVPQIGY